MMGGLWAGVPRVRRDVSVAIAVSMIVSLTATYDVRYLERAAFSWLDVPVERAGIHMGRE